jgi:hypothetical protein
MCVRPDHLVLSLGMPDIQLRQMDIDRFWSYVDKSGGPDVCWPWIGATKGKSKTGKSKRGCFTLGGVRQFANRVAFAIKNGGICSKEILVRHTCNNDICCNPDHLIAGSHSDNMDDKVKADRCYKPRGEENVNSVLTEEQVIQMRTARATGTILQVLSEQYGVSIATAAKVCNGDLWAHAGGPITKKFTRGTIHH